METTEYGQGITVDSDSMRAIVRVNGKTVKSFKGAKVLGLMPNATLWT